MCLLVLSYFHLLMRLSFSICAPADLTYADDFNADGTDSYLVDLPQASPCAESILCMQVS